MLTKTRSRVVALSCALVMAIGACGGDEDGDGNGNGHTPGGSEGNVRNGTWEVTTILDWSGCPADDETIVAEEEICNLEARFEGELVGSTIACDVEIDEDREYTIACSGDSSYLGCTIHVDLHADGTHTDSTYTLTGHAVFTFSGGPAYCSQPACTLDIVESGEWINATAECEDDTTAAAPRREGLLLKGLRRVLAP